MPTPPPIPADALTAPGPGARLRPPALPGPAANPMPSPWDDEVVASAPPPTPVKAEPLRTWLNNPAYQLVHPSHAEELEQTAAVNEFGRKMPREAAEAEAHASYVKRHHTMAAAHHLAGMKAAHAAGDMESARKHSLMYGLHSKALGHDPVGPAHPDVAAHLSQPQKVTKFKPHAGDVFALHKEKAPEVQASSPPPALGKSETLALKAIWLAGQAVLAKAETAGGVQPGRPVVTEKFHGQGTQLGPSVQRDIGPHHDAHAHIVNKSLNDWAKAELAARQAPKKTCRCNSYAFPHRHRGGKCMAHEPK